MLAEQIRNKELLEESIKELKKENPTANLQLLEKTVGALYLVENLVNKWKNEKKWEKTRFREIW